MIDEACCLLTIRARFDLDVLVILNSRPSNPGLPIREAEEMDFDGLDNTWIIDLEAREERILPNVPTVDADRFRDGENWTSFANQRLVSEMGIKEWSFGDPVFFCLSYKAKLMTPNHQSCRVVGRGENFGTEVSLVAKLTVGCWKLGRASHQRH